MPVYPVSGCGSCPGSFGEVIQGIFPDNTKFLMPLKIERYSRASIVIGGRKDGRMKNVASASDRSFDKSFQVIRTILREIRIDQSFTLSIESALPEGKGLSSSTADMVSSLRALEKALGITLSDATISRLISEIEPNDGLHLTGSVLYDYVNGKSLFSNSYVPDFFILGFDTGGMVDTVRFNQRTPHFSKKEKQYYKSLAVKIQEALMIRDKSLIGRIAQKSAELWQKVLPKPNFAEFLSLSKSLSGCGIINSHSGTYLGIAFDAAKTDRSDLLYLSRNDPFYLFKKYPVTLFETHRQNYLMRTETIISGMEQTRINNNEAIIRRAPALSM